MPSNNFPNIGFNNTGRDYNFFQKTTVTWSTFGGGSTTGTQPDQIFTGVSQGILILNETASTIVQISFNGNTVHDEINTSLIQGVSYDNRVLSAIWFRIISGVSATISVRGWSIR